MRILNEQFSRLTREVGNVFLPILSKILPYLNAIVMVLTEIVSIIARLFGYRKEDYDYFETMADDVYDFSDGVSEASSGVEKLKRGLRGFDKLNNITTPTSASGGIGGATGIDPDLMNAFNKAYDDYFKKISQVEMKATRIRDKIMEWLGFEKKIDKVTGDIYFKFKKITSGTILGALAIGGSIYLGLKTLFNIFSKITGIKFTGITTMVKNIAKIPEILSLISPQVAIIIGIVTTLIAVFTKLYKTNDEFRKKVDNFIKMLKDDFMVVLKDIKELLVPFLQKVWDILKEIWNNVIKPLGSLLVDILEPILSTIVDLLSLLWKTVIEPLYPILKWLVNIALDVIVIALQAVSKTLEAIVKFLKLLWKEILEPFFNFVIRKLQDYIIPIVSSIEDIAKKVKRAIDEVINWWNNLKINPKEVLIKYGAVGAVQEIQDKYKNYNYSRANGGVLVNGKWQPVNYYDSGGLPPVGQMFVARENGPELVGNIGSHTAVMNNDQIVSSVAYGVEGAVTRAMRSANQGKQVFNIYLDQDHKIGTYTLEQLQDMAKSNGKPLRIGD